MKRYFFLITAMTFVLFGYSQTTPKFNIQGTLKNANGAAVQDGAQQVVFRLYNQQQGGTPVWTETATVTVTGGVYNYNLGSGVTLPPDIFTEGLYLGVVIDGSELSPRGELTSAPYAFHASTAQRITGCQGAIGDVKQSILPLNQFQAVNGDCWVELNGAALLSDNPLRQLTGMANLPDARGVFLRSMDSRGGDGEDPDRGNSPQVGSWQGDQYRSHNHSVNDPGHSHVWNNGLEGDDSGGGGSFSEYTRVPGQVHDAIQSATTGIGINHAGGSETRPKNISVYTYIRIN
jgi:hypothetical protein